MKCVFRIFTVFLVFFMLLPMLPMQGSVIVAHYEHHEEDMSRQEIEDVLDIDKLQEEFVQNDILHELDVRPPCTLEIWLRIVGLPILNAFVAVRKSLREAWAHLLGKQAPAIIHDTHE